MNSMLRITALVAAFGLPTFSWAQGSCTHIQNDDERLACYDRANAPTISVEGGITEAAINAATIVASATSQPTASQPGDWDVRVETNKLDDSKTVFSMLDATNGDGMLGSRISLIARCKSNKTEVYINWNDYLGNDLPYDANREAKRVTYRIDSTPAQQGTWSISTDNEATFVTKPIGFLRNLADSKRLVVQTTPYNASPVQAVFNTSGARDALQELSETCHWQL